VPGDELARPNESARFADETPCGASAIAKEEGMCDFVSWIEKDKKIYFLDDATIEPRGNGQGRDAGRAGAEDRIARTR